MKTKFPQLPMKTTSLLSAALLAASFIFSSHAGAATATLGQSVLAKLDQLPMPSIALINRLHEVLGIDSKEMLLLAHPEAKSLLGSSADLVPLEDPAKAWQRFVSSKTLRARYHITAREIQALKHLSLLGYVLTEREFLAVLTLIRQPEDN